MYNGEWGQDKIFYVFDNGTNKKLGGPYIHVCGSDISLIRNKNKLINLAT